MVNYNLAMDPYNGMLNGLKRFERIQVTQHIDLMFKYLQSKVAIILPQAMKVDMLEFFNEFSFNKKFLSGVSLEKRRETALYKILDIFARLINEDIKFMCSMNEFYYSLKSWSRYVDEGHGSRPDNELYELCKILNQFDDYKYIVNISKLEMQRYMDDLELEMINFVRTLLKYNLIKFIEVEPDLDDELIGA